MKHEEQEHPSYGMVSVSYFNSNGTDFFGSDIKHQGGVTIELCQASVNRELSQEWYHARNLIARIELSKLQFVELITSALNSQGVPCTIKFLNGKVEQIQHVGDKRALFQSEMVETIKEFKDRIAQIEQKVADVKEKKVSKEIAHELRVLKDLLGSNEAFVMEQFNRAMDRSVNEAKQSIAAYYDNKLASLGLDAMKEQSKQIENGTENK